MHEKNAQEVVTEQAQRARRAARVLANLSLDERNDALRVLAQALRANSASIVEANALDRQRALGHGTPSNIIDRLLLDDSRLEACALALEDLLALEDPLGKVVEGRTIAAGLGLRRVTVPLGVVGMIYEARPNVTVDAAGIGLKTGNAMLLRGSSLALETNRVLIDVMSKGLLANGFPDDALQMVDATDRESVRALMHLHGKVDVLIPRGGAGLIATVVTESTVPVIETGTGNCHIYLADDADPEKACAITLNAKTQRDSVCNAAESLLVDSECATTILTRVGAELVQAGVELRADTRSRELLESAGIACVAASKEDFGTEFLGPIMSVAVVDGIDRAIAHINKYGTGHSEAIVTESLEHAHQFQRDVDAAAVYVNASTRFTDGALFGLGAEIGISTQKLHARGPMGLSALTTTKCLIDGSGQIRQ